MKLWNKGYQVDKLIEKYTVGNDYILDQQLVQYDCDASIAHTKMLAKIKILTKSELADLIKGLNEIKALYKDGKFSIKPEDEDCHTAIENFLTEKYGEAGKKIHTARSRNDQVLTAIRLYEKANVHEIITIAKLLHQSLEGIIKKYGLIPIPGYTHMQKAMPTTVKVWLGSYQDALSDDITQLENVKKLIDQSPLGSAAGFGVPILNLDKKMTAKELGFSQVQENPMYCQLSRGKFEIAILASCSQIMLTINRLSSDLILFSMKECGWVILPKDFCTGSSIMPQKYNPDVLELLRASYHIVKGEENKIANISANLISGYNRDMQLTKQPLMYGIQVTIDSLVIASHLIKELIIDKEKAKSNLTAELYATEKALQLVKEGTSFRDAYKIVASEFSNQQKDTK